MKANIAKYEEVLKEFKEKVQEELGSSLKQLVLFGSLANKEVKEGSDIDVFVLVDSRKAKEKVIKLAYEIGALKNGILIMPIIRIGRKPLPLNTNSFLREVKRTGKIYV